MRIWLWPAVGMAALLLVSCSSLPTAQAPQQAEVEKPADETRRFPSANLVQTRVVEKQLFDKPFMPGGTLADYQRGKIAYNMFLARLPSAADASFLLLDWNKALASAHLVPSFGGYFGLDAGRPVFVFTKGAWIAGVVGLSEKDADTQARSLAAHLNE